MTRNSIRKTVCLLLALSLTASPAAEMSVIAVDSMSTTQMNTLTPDEKIADEVQALMDAGETEIPVFIWYNEIDQNTIELQVEQQIGFSINELESTYAPPSAELLAALSDAAAEVQADADVQLNAGNDSASINAYDLSIDASDMTISSSTYEYLDLLMESHMELTAPARELEKEKTDLYLSARREICSELHTAEADSLIDELAFADESVAFVSQFAPLVICSLSPTEITRASENAAVTEIGLYEELGEVEECSLEEVEETTESFADNIIKDVMGVDDINEHLNLTGEDVKIGIYEWGTVYDGDESVPPPTTDPVQAETNATEVGKILAELDPSRVTLVGDANWTGTHSSWSAINAAGEHGVAPDAMIYSIAIGTDNDILYSWKNVEKLQNLENAINQEISLFNISAGTVRYYDSSEDQEAGSANLAFYTQFEKYLDYLVEYERITAVVATGNYNDNNSKYYQCCINSPALSYNCIAVNGFRNDSDGNLIVNDNNYLNGDGCLKPDVVSYSYTPGTSTAAPVITGMLALLVQYKPSLAAQPHLLKAILMASCHQKLDKVYTDNGYVNFETLAEPLSDGLTARQGAGAPNMYTMVSIVAQHSYGSGILNAGNSYTKSIRFCQPKYGASNINVCMAYLQKGANQENPNAVINNCDLYLTNSGFSSPTTKSSVNTNSSTELIYTAMPDTENYTLRVSKTSGSSESIEFAYAWSTDNTTFFPTVEEEGIYSVKNANSGYYLTLNNSTLETKQSSYSVNGYRRWILNYSSANNQYTLMSTSGTEKNLTVGSLVSTDNYKAIGTSATASNITLEPNDDGSVSFTRTYGNRVLALGVYEASTSTNAQVVWKEYDATDTSQKWFLESILYKRGDYDADGVLDEEDAENVLAMAAAIGAGGTSYTNRQYFLADYDQDNQVTSSDASLIYAILP